MTILGTHDPFAGFTNPKRKSFSYKELKGKFPEGVKGKSKEDYLEDDEFEKVFEMTKNEFAELKAWKQTELKKKKGLF